MAEETELIHHIMVRSVGATETLKARGLQPTEQEIHTARSRLEGARDDMARAFEQALSRLEAGGGDR